MSNIKLAIQQLASPKKEIGEILIEFYETMKSLESDKERGGKQATKIVMTLNDIENICHYGQDYEEAKREVTAEEAGIFYRKECCFKYCPSPELCQEKCISGY